MAAGLWVNEEVLTSFWSEFPGLCELNSTWASVDQSKTCWHELIFPGKFQLGWHYFGLLSYTQKNPLKTLFCPFHYKRHRKTPVEPLWDYVCRAWMRLASFSFSLFKVDFLHFPQHIPPAMHATRVLTSKQVVIVGVQPVGPWRSAAGLLAEQICGLFPAAVWLRNPSTHSRWGTLDTQMEDTTRTQSITVKGFLGLMTVRTALTSRKKAVVWNDAGRENPSLCIKSQIYKRESVGTCVFSTTNTCKISLSLTFFAFKRYFLPVPVILDAMTARLIR